MVFIVSKRLTPPFILEALGLRIASLSGEFMASIWFANTLKAYLLDISVAHTEANFGFLKKNKIKVHLYTFLYRRLLPYLRGKSIVCWRVPQFTEIVPLEQLLDEKYSIALCYPKYNSQEAAKRIRELHHLGVVAIEFAGEKTVSNVPVLGKGCVGIVVAARVGDEKVALKIRRTDADRAGMQHEAEMLQAANKIDVGPRFIGSSANFLLMKFLDGGLLPEWVEWLKGKETRSRIRRVLRDVLEQCWRLDEAGLDHGELSQAPKHIIVDEDEKAHLVDFETASTKRRVSNVTSMCQFLFIGSRTARIVRRKLGKMDQETLRTLLRSYKQNRSRQDFDRILNLCGLGLK